MKVFVTGATGRVGNAIVHALHSRGDEVTALVRDPGRARSLVPTGVTLARGDVTDAASVREAVEGCALVFNAMGLPEQWVRDEEIFERVNARGTENVVRAARDAGVARFIQTSTIDVFHAEPGGRFDETQIADYPKNTAYERSKQHAEELALAACGPAMELVFANPSAVYGPGPGSVSLEKQLFEPVARGILPFVVHGGMGVVHARGVAAGHLLIAERGRPRERYILCDRHVTLRELSQMVVRVAHRGRVPWTVPVWFARGTTALGEVLARRTGMAPLISSRGQLEFVLWNAAPDSTKAQEELGWEPTPLEDGIREWLDSDS